MTYKLNILKNANKDLAWFRQHDRTSYIKCFDFVRAVIEPPRTGTGKPERLKYFEKEVYSRRVNLKDSKSQLGIAGSLKFLLEYSKGKGNYTELRKEIFKGQSVDDILEDMDKTR